MAHSSDGCCSQILDKQKPGGPSRSPTYVAGFQAITSGLDWTGNIWDRNQDPHRMAALLAMPQCWPWESAIEVV